MTNERKDPELKNPRYEIVILKSGAPRRVTYGFLQPPPDVKETYVCPAGPGMPAVPKAGRWLPMTDYLWRRLRDGDLVEGTAPTIEKKSAPEKKPPVKEGPNK